MKIRDCFFCHKVIHLYPLWLFWKSDGRQYGLFAYMHYRCIAPFEQRTPGL